MASKSAHDGLFIEGGEYSEEQKEKFHKIMRTCKTMTQKEWYNLILQNYPLLYRGWAFQERLLARRIVHFTKMELIWECMEDRWCECAEQSLNTGLSGKANNMNSALKDCRNKPTAAKIRLMWRECVKNFSKRDLTVVDDRLEATDGIASYLRGPDPAAYTCLYLQGPWEDALPWGLLWYCDQTSKLEKAKVRGPSYSWSSVECGIEGPACDDCPKLERPSPAISTGTCFEFRFE
jgi:hypothetical protein